MSCQPRTYNPTRPPVDFARTYLLWRDVFCRHTAVAPSRLGSPYLGTTLLIAE